MEDKVLQNGWKRLSSDTGNDYLFKTYPTGSMSAAIKFLNTTAELIQKSGLDNFVHISLSSDSMTIALNSPALTQLNDDHFKLAQQLDTLL